MLTGKGEDAGNDTRRTQMRYLTLLGMLFCLSVVAYAQTPKPTNSFFDDSEMKAFDPKSIVIQGEVQDAGPVDLSSLPIRSVAIKEMGLENGQRVFKGAFFVSGYSLYDILNSKNFKKAPENTFPSPTDLYVVVENDKGEKAAFSWGEIYYRNSFDILITKTIQPINPARAKASYVLPDTPRLICAGDLVNARFISNPARITVKSYHGSMPKDKPKDIYSPELNVVSKTGSFKIGDIGSSVEKRTVSDVSYGHGMGFKGSENVTGYLLKDLISANLKPTPDMLREWIAVASAKDGYRVVISLSEIMNRGDNQDFLLMDKKDTPGSGRYHLYPAGDFFADRDVRAVEKLELFGLQ
jgi:hypothetical protein